MICGKQSPAPGPLGMHYYCTRDRGHEGQHVAEGSHGETVGRWEEPARMNAPEVLHRGASGARVMGIQEFSEEELARHHEQLDEELDGDVAAARIAKEYGVTIEELKGRRRHKKLSLARQALYSALRDARWSFPRIGRFVGRDHATVIYGVRAFSGQPRRQERRQT